MLPGVHPISDRALGNTSYLVECGSGVAVSIDPRRDPDDHLRLAATLGVRIVAVLETHLHADFVSGAREIAAATGAEVVVAAEAAVAFEHRGVREGDRITFGGTTFLVIETPGHTPEHISFVLEGRAVFSGGSMIDGGAARTDLIGPTSTEDLSRAQFRSLRRIAALGDDVALCPTHGAGSFCSTGPARSGSTTIGEQRRVNPLLAFDDETIFVDTLRQGFATYPPYFGHLRAVNRDGAPLLADVAPARPLTAEAARDAVARGAWLIDGRPFPMWAHEHPDGAISNTVRDAFASWLGWIVPFGDPVVLLVDEADRPDAIGSARAIGYDTVLGWIDGGIDAWRAAGQPTRRAEIVTAKEAAERNDPFLDVRQAAEYADAHIAGALHLELGDLIAGKTPSAGRLIAYCGHGERSATAASLLERAGVRAATLDGGIGAWEEAGLPIHR